MTAHEQTTVAEQLRARIEAILSVDQLALYDAYRERLVQGSVTTTPDEQAVLDLIAADHLAAALDRQLAILLRVTKLPQ